MELFDVVLFLHILAVLTAFGVASVLHTAEWTAPGSATTVELRASLRVVRRLEPVFPVLLLVLFGLGAWLIHLSKTTDEKFGYDDDWIRVSIIGVIVLFVVGGAVLAPRSKKHGKVVDAATDGPLTPELRGVVTDPVLWLATHFQTSLALSIVFLMTTKPDLTGCIIVILVGPAIGLLIGTLGLSRARRLAAS